MIKIKDIIHDILYNSLKNIDYDGMIDLLIQGAENHRFPKAAYIPIYKMLKKSTKYKNTTIFKDRKIVKSYNDIIINNHIKKCKNIDDLKHTLEKTFDSDDLNGCLTILLTNIDTIDKEHLRKYLTLIYDKDESKINKSEFRKLVCYLDFLENA